MDAVTIKLALMSAALESCSFTEKEEALEAAKEAYNWVMEGITVIDENGHPDYLKPVQ